MIYYLIHMTTKRVRYSLVIDRVKRPSNEPDGPMAQYYIVIGVCNVCTSILAQ